MSLFSHRAGIRPAKKAIQREAIDDELRNRLWSALKIIVWDKWSAYEYGYQPPEAKCIDDLSFSLWIHHFKKPADTLVRFGARQGKSFYDVIREYFFGAEWWEVFDLLEYIAKELPEAWRLQLTEAVNRFLEEESSAYRFIDVEVVEITDSVEIAAIESGLEVAIGSARVHLQQALSLLSDRKKPDYRNSIKESISAVEAIGKHVSGLPKATLGDSVKALKSKGHMHPSFEQAILKLYGYTSDEGGIRHALSEDSEPPAYSEAKFMLVACSAFVSFVLARAAELGIK